jgi:hypothetical protein
VCCRRRAVAAVGCLRLVCTQDCSLHCPRASGAHVARRDAATVAVQARRRSDPVISCPPSMTSVKQYIVAGSRRRRRARWKQATRESVEIELIGLQRAVGAYLGCGETFPVGGFGEDEFGLVRPYQSPGLSIRPQQSKTSDTTTRADASYAGASEAQRGREADAGAHEARRGHARACEARLRGGDLLGRHARVT